MKIMKTYRFTFYNTETAKVDHTEFCAESFLEARLQFVEWCLYDIAGRLLPIIFVTQVYDGDDAEIYNSDDYEDTKYDDSLEPGEGASESEFTDNGYDYVERNEILTHLYDRMIRRGATSDEINIFIENSKILDGVVYPLHMIEMFKKYGC